MNAKKYSTATRAIFTVLIAALVAACSGGPRALDHGDRAYADGKFRAALSYYLQAEQEGEDAEILRPRLANARLAAGMETAQRKFFAGELEAALEDFRTIHELRPGDDLVALWIRKSRLALCNRHRKAGRELALLQDFKGARAELEIAESYWPGHPAVAEIAAEVQNWSELLLQKAEKYYEAGNRDYSKNLVEPAHAEFTMAYYFDEDHENARKRMVQTQRLVVAKRVGKARELVSKGRWYAAVKLLMEILKKEPDYPPAVELLALARSEREAWDLLQNARNLRSRRDFAEARRALDTGLLLTTKQEAEFREESLMLRSAELWAIYIEGLKYEFEGRYEHALTKYKDVIDPVAENEELYAQSLVAPIEYQSDLELPYDPGRYERNPQIWYTYSRCRQRHENLAEQLAVVRTYYDEARLLEDAGKLKAAISIYEDILLELRNFRDVYDRVNSLRARSGEAPGGRVQPPPEAPVGTAPEKS